MATADLGSGPWALLAFPLPQVQAQQQPQAFRAGTLLTLSQELRGLHPGFMSNPGCLACDA